MKNLILLGMLFAASISFAAEKKKKAETPAPAVEEPAQPAAEPEAKAEEPEGKDSFFRPMVNLGVGSLSIRGEGAGNVLSQDYKSGGSAAFGGLMNFRPGDRWGFETGMKFLLMSREAKVATTPKLSLTLLYLAIPAELTYKIIPIRKRSYVYLKGGLTYMYLLSAEVDEEKEDTDGDTDWDDWDVFPSPPAQGSYRSSFNRSDWLASLGVGADFLLFQLRNSFNMSLVPEIMYYHGLTTISKSGEFGGDVRNKGMLVNFSVAFGF